MNSIKLGSVRKLKLLLFKKNIEFRFNQIELQTYDLSMLAKPKTILFSKNAKA